jgi:hypothetical protein
VSDVKPTNRCPFACDQGLGLAIEPTSFNTRWQLVFQRGARFCGQRCDDMMGHSVFLSTAKYQLHLSNGPMK